MIPEAACLFPVVFMRLLYYIKNIESGGPLPEVKLKIHRHGKEARPISGNITAVFFQYRNAVSKDGKSPQPQALSDNQTCHRKHVISGEGYRVPEVCAIKACPLISVLKKRNSSQYGSDNGGTRPCCNAPKSRHPLPADQS